MTLGPRPDLRSSRLATSAGRDVSSSRTAAIACRLSCAFAGRHVACALPAFVGFGASRPGAGRRLAFSEGTDAAEALLRRWTPPAARRPLARRQRRPQRAAQVWNSNASSPAKGSIRSTRSNGRCARPSSATRRARSSSSSATSRFPRFWSQQATNIVVSKYFRGQHRHARARAQRQAAHRPRRRHDHRLGARSSSYFASEDDLQAFSDDLKHLLVYQKAAFNSPVWFNSASRRRRSARPASSTPCRTRWSRSSAWRRPRACCSSTAPAPARTCRRSARRSELLAGGGTASGPVSFMKGFDAFAGVIKSGGKTRRAAKMVILNADHPDIVEFINCKVEEEKKAWALIDAGYDGSFTGPAYASVFFQNSNNTVRVTDEFMRAVLDDGEWQTRAVHDRRGDGHLQGARPDAADRRGARRSAAIRACSSTPRSTTGTPARTRRASTPATRARSTCSWTTRRATWRRST